MNFRKSDTIVAVIGDHCLDKDYRGDLTEVMSREQKDMRIFGSDCLDTHYSGGGAANIVDLLQHWGVRVLPVGVWNPLHDENSNILLNQWSKGYVNTRFMVEGYGTPAFVKYYKESGEHTFRANEHVDYGKPEIQKELIHQIELLSKEPIDIVIVADYDEAGRGVLTNTILQAIYHYIQCPKIGLSRQRIRKLQEYQYLILNEEELEKQTDANVDLDWLDRAYGLFTATGAEQFIVTLEGKGAALYDWPDKRTDYADIKQATVDSVEQEGQINVCGCGDTFTAAFAICIASGMDEVEAIKRANAAARVQTRKHYGARTVDLSEWEAEYNLLYGENDEQRACSAKVLQV